MNMNPQLDMRGRPSEVTLHLQDRIAEGVAVLLLDGAMRQCLPICEHLRRLGAHVVTLNTSRLDPGYVSRWPTRRLLGPDPRDDPQGALDAVRRILETNQFDVVIPAQDITADILARHRAELSELAAVAVNDPAVHVKGRDKLVTMQACADLGVPHPRTWGADEPGLIDKIQGAGFGGPLVVKPREAWGARGFRVVQDLNDLLMVVRDVERSHGPALVQEYIPQDELQYKCQVFLDRSGQIHSSVTYSKIRWFPLKGGASTLNETVQRPDIDAVCATLLRGIGWRGYADVDLIQDPRDGMIKVMEINPRITGSVKICFDAGVDFARQILEDALDLPVTSYHGYECGRYLRSMHTDILWFLLSPSRFRCRPSWFDFRRTTDQIVSLRDPLPAAAYSLQAVSRILKRFGTRGAGV